MAVGTRRIGSSISQTNQLISRRRKLRMAAAVGLISAAIPQIARADANWVGGTSSDWSNTANWSANPSGQTLIINNTTNFPVISGTPGFTPVDLRIGTGATARVDQTAGTAGTGSGNWMFLGYSAGTATYNLANTATSGGTFTGYGQGSGSFTNTGDLLLGLDNGTKSTFNINTSGTVTAGYVALGSTGNSSGKLNIDSGTVTVSGELQVGGNMFGQGSGTDTLSMSGGTLTANVISFSRGNDNTNVMTGIGNITGGTLTANAYLTLGFAGSASALASVTNNGGTINVGKTGTAAMEMTVYDSVSAQYTQGSGALNIDNNSTIAFGNGGNNNSTSTFTQNGGNVTFYSDAGTTVGGTGSLILGVGGSTGTYAYNLNGGTLTVPLVQKTAAGASGTFNFNGGTLKAAGNSTTFMTGLTAANVQAGGAIIDTNGFNATIGTNLSDGTGGGGFTKLNTGNLTLSANSSYTGATVISGGTLKLSGNFTNNVASSKAIAVGSGATLDVTGLTNTASTIILANGQALGGSGNVSGEVVVASGSKISAGTSIALSTGTSDATATLTTGNETWNAGGTYKVKAASLGSTAARGTGGSGTTGTSTTWDDLSMSGLTFSSLGGGNSSFTIGLSDLSTLPTTVGNSYSWVIAQSTAGVTPPAGYTIGTGANSNLLVAGTGGGSAAFILDTSAFAVSGTNVGVSASNFTLELVASGGGDNLVLDYNATPEPGSGLLMLAGGIPALMARRRRRAKPACVVHA